MTDAELRDRVFRWATILRVRPRQIRVQRMTRKWASCSLGGTVTFSLDLLKQPIAFQEYVMVHELLHLRLSNHGRLFRSTLRVHLRGNPWTEPGATRRLHTEKKKAASRRPSDSNG